MNRRGKQPASPRLSLSMIVRNEERFLPDCLASVKGIVDEIVIVDTGSTDATYTIATNAGCMITPMEWSGDFSLARNESLSRCSGEWILYLDADERLVGGQADLLKRLLRDQDIAAYSMIVRSTIALKDGHSVELMRYPRLFRRNPRVRFEGMIHEQIGPSILRSGGRILPSTLTIDHLGYSQSFDVLREKIERNMGPLLLLAERDPLNWYARLQVARSLMVLQEYTNALPFVREALSTPGIPKASVAILHNLQAEIMMKTGQHAAAAEECRQSLRLFPRQFGARWFLAGALANTGDIQEAIPALEELLGMSEPSLATTSQLEDDIVLPSYAVWDLLGRCYAGVGELGKAAASLMTAVRGSSSRECLTRLIEVHERLGRPHAATRDFEELTLRMPEEPRIHLYLALWYKRTGDVVRALDALRRVLKLEPAHAVALSWMALWSLERREFEQVEQTLMHAAEYRVESDELKQCAFSLALEQKHYSEALCRLKAITHLIPSTQFNALEEKLAKLAGQF